MLGEAFGGCVREASLSRYRLITQVFNLYFTEDIHYVGISKDLSDLASKTNVVASNDRDVLRRLEEMASESQAVALN